MIEASSIALFLDYDGTLAEIRKNPADAYPSQEIRELFSILADTPRLDVCIISGRKRADMLDWFGAYDFFLVAEHGFFYRSGYHPLHSSQILPARNRGSLSAASLLRSVCSQNRSAPRIYQNRHHQWLLWRRYFAR